MNSLEGRRGEPRVKPPFPAAVGAFGMPSTINNVETLASVPHIVSNGADWYKQWGTEKSPGTKLFCVSGHVVRPGNYEMPMGFNFKEFIYDVCGGVPDGRALKAVIPGGSSVPDDAPRGDRRGHGLRGLRGRGHHARRRLGDRHGRDHRPGEAGPPHGGLLRARVAAASARPAARAPPGPRRSCAASRAAGAPSPTSTRCWTSPTTWRGRRSACSPTPARRRSPRRSRSSAKTIWRSSAAARTWRRRRPRNSSHRFPVSSTAHGQLAAGMVTGN